MVVQLSIKGHAGTCGATTRQSRKTQYGPSTYRRNAMKQMTLCTLFLLALAALAAPGLAAPTLIADPDSSDDVSFEDLIEAQPLQSLDDGASAEAAPMIIFDESEFINECSGGGATCKCSGTCEADSGGCKCT